MNFFYFVEFSEPISAFCEVQSLSAGISTGAFSFGSGTGRRAQIYDFTFTMSTNAMSPKLLLACASGKPFKTVSIECYRDVNHDAIVTYNLEDVVIARMNSNGRVDTIGLSAAKVQIQNNSTPG